MARVAFVTFGCTLNFADSELMMGLLKQAGHSIAKSISDAELVVVNSCSVKQLAEKKFFRAVSDAAAQGKKVVCAGCVPQAEQGYLSKELKGYSAVGTKQLNRIAHVVEETLAGNVVHLLKEEKNERMNIPKVRRNRIIGIIPIAEGCLGNCTYCKSRFARGELVSYGPEEIVKQVISDVRDGCKEIWLTSQDCGAYGKDIGTDIVALLRAVCAVEGDFMVRLGMINPNFALEYLDDLIDVYKENKGKLFWFIHLPLQAGSNRVLKLMNRKYIAADFVRICSAFRDAMPEITIATDVICGFPTETTSDFQSTKELILHVQPDVVNVSRFWPRPGTAAATMEGQLHGRGTNLRSREMGKVKEEVSLARNKTWLGWQGIVTVDERGTVGAGESWVGRNYAYKPVGIKGRYGIGQPLDVKVKKAKVYHLEGEPV
ncbi:tRNA (N(6)-L-threonylcarbamoyladenosine(37)-C(2))-methylthiotransferase [Candidatus Woesearchaeota archaeon]|nr:tRNA (N(6)-L-threonylcarbamoyladenosine(37)-C(2))-methylthiotransferase [Candidatus Woesearchaeota archaeon]